MKQKRKSISGFLAFHPHIHALVTGVGVNSNGDLIYVKGKDKFLYNVKAISKVFRAKFAEKITQAENTGLLKICPLIRKLMFQKAWVVFAQRPFSTPINWSGKSMKSVVK